MTDRIKGTYTIYDEYTGVYDITFRIPGCPEFTFNKTWKSRHGAQGAAKRIAEKLNLELTEVK